MKTIGIIGYGYVGKAIEQFILRREDLYQLCIADTAIQTKENQYANAIKDIAERADYVFVCVPTPQGGDGRCDISIVESVVARLSEQLQVYGRRSDCTIIMKSTVEIGTTDYLVDKYNVNIVFSPEYCGESKYWSPYAFDTEIAETPFFIFGGSHRQTSKAVDLFLTVTGPVKQYMQTSAKVAETMKYVENSFYATKIAFCNMVADICEANNIDWNTVREGWLLDPRVNPMHTAVFTEDRGFGGKCLPKDTSALMTYGKALGVDTSILQAVLEYNNKLREKKQKKEQIHA